MWSMRRNTWAWEDSLINHQLHKLEYLSVKPRIHIKIGHGDAHVCSPSALGVEMDESWSARASQASQSVSPSFNQKPCLKI